MVAQSLLFTFLVTRLVQWQTRSRDESAVTHNTLLRDTLVATTKAVGEAVQTAMAPSPVVHTQEALEQKVTEALNGYLDGGGSTFNPSDTADPTDAFIREDRPDATIVSSGDLNPFGIEGFLTDAGQGFLADPIGETL